jgi:hypothetical protein
MINSKEYKMQGARTTTNFLLESNLTSQKSQRIKERLNKCRAKKG